MSFGKTIPLEFGDNLKGNERKKKVSTFFLKFEKNNLKPAI